MSEPSAPPPPNRPSMSKRLRLPEVSGKWTVVWLLICFLLTGILIPIMLKLPTWIEFESVVGIWWILWRMILTKLLYKGEQVSDDHERKEARLWSYLKGGFPAKGAAENGGPEGCLLLVGLIAALFLVWALIEIAIPIVFFLLYFLVRGMLVHVVNDKTRCQGNVSLSAARGFLWATVYTVPLAATIWIVHWINARHGG